MADTEVSDETVEQLKELHDELEALSAELHDRAYDRDGYDFEKEDALADLQECVADAKKKVDRGLNVAYNVNHSSPGPGYDL